jgi:hypothetical protein
VFMVRISLVLVHIQVEFCKFRLGKLNETFSLSSKCLREKE